ncbi:hypothetical protein HDU86_000317 [Geranomyces michiganensis]|nr:hypothetical protein HDU86_000317 [Geranomyces michiganensis]
MTAIAHTTRNFVDDNVSETVRVALDAGQDVRGVFEHLNCVEDLKGRIKTAEYETQLEELQAALKETKRKLCQAELEIKSLHQKHREHTGTKKKTAHIYQKTKAAAFAKEGLFSSMSRTADF